MLLPSKIVMASSNPGKLRELERLLEPLGIRVLPQSAFGISDAEESGTTFEANAIIKARHALQETGLAAIADDSGLVVEALGGRPGVYSARYAGVAASDAENIDKLLAELEGAEDRAAAFHCVTCFVAPDLPEPICTTGTWCGEILRERRGTSGFGYDPVFLDPATGLASAELSPVQKNARSHRGQALRKLVARLRETGR